MHTEIVHHYFKHDSWKKTALPGIKHMILNIVSLKLSVEHEGVYELSKYLCLNSGIQLQLSTDSEKVYYKAGI